MTDAFAEREVLEERSLELREHPGPGQALPDGVDEADALDQRRDLLGGDDAEPVIGDEVNEADAIDQATPVAFDDDEWRDG